MRQGLFKRRRAARARTSSYSFMLVYLNLMITLVPVLFSIAVFSKIAIVDLHLPKVEENLEPIPVQGKAPSFPLFSLTVAIKGEGLAVSNGGKKLAFLPRRDGKLDFDGLSMLLQRLKKEHPNGKEVVVLSLPETPYEDLIAVMDACRMAQVGDGNARSIQSLFPDVSLGEAS